MATPSPDVFSAAPGDVIRIDVSAVNRSGNAS